MIIECIFIGKKIIEKEFLFKTSSFFFLNDTIFIKFKAAQNYLL